MRVLVFVAGAFVMGNREDSVHSSSSEATARTSGSIGSQLCDRHDTLHGNDADLLGVPLPGRADVPGRDGLALCKVLDRSTTTTAPDEECRRFLTLPAGRSGRLRHQRGAARHPYGFHAGAPARNAASSRRRMSSGPSVDAPPSRYIRRVMCGPRRGCLAPERRGGRDVRGAGVCQDQAAAQGSTISMSTSSKSRTLRVATAMRRQWAIAAIWQSAGALSARIAPA